MKKITYIIAGGLLIAATACNKPAEFDQASCERTADSIVDARCAVEAPAVEAEYSEMCTRQLAVLTATRDSLSSILATASNVKPKKKGTTTKTPTTTTKSTEDKVTGTKGSGQNKDVITGTKGSGQNKDTIIGVKGQKK